MNPPQIFAGLFCIKPALIKLLKSRLWHLRFLSRIKARHGLRVLDAEASEDTRWAIKVETTHKNKGGMVTAYVNTEDYSKTDR